MIFAEWKPIDEIVEKLAGCKSVLLIGCATCVAECAAGGEREVETLAPLLKMALKKQGSDVEIITATLEKQCEWEFVEEIADLISKVDAVVSIACGIGIQAVAERFSEIAVYPGVNTSALTIREESGVWAGRCQACGECVLGETFGICPVSRCAKSLMNGPCGGTRKEVSARSMRISIVYGTLSSTVPSSAVNLTVLPRSERLRTGPIRIMADLKEFSGRILDNE